MVTPTHDGTGAAAIEARGLTKAFHTQSVLRGLDFTLPWGACLSLFGANGSGKTTLVRTLATLTRHDSGTLRIASLDPARQATEVRQTIGVLTHQTFLYDHLTGLENLHFYGRMYGVPAMDTRIVELARALDFERYMSRRVHTLSHGMQKRIGLARALLHRPRLLLLDEPETGLDQHAIGILERLLKDHCAQGGSVFLTTHNVEKGLTMADHVAILVDGRIAYYQPRALVTPADFRSLYIRVAGVPV
ncbi:MAG: heme ABC exporter ATP-binding protein CcmA [Dehalococcoidia bacterium]|nr:heme ABC exporter ATP-binding protein CcmA [Dehalococcoidia bacterium]